MTTTWTSDRFRLTPADLARLDADLADLQRARQLLHRAEALAGSDPRAAFETVHRAALRGAGILVAQANRERRRKLPLNVWTALGRLGVHERVHEVEPQVAERARLERDLSALPDPLLRERHLHDTARHLDAVAGQVRGIIPTRAAALAG